MLQNFKETTRFQVIKCSKFFKGFSEFQELPGKFQNLSKKNERKKQDLLFRP